MDRYEITTIICSECGVGNFRQQQHGGDYARCDHCGAEVSITRDLMNVADDGETVVVEVSGTLAVVSQD